MLHRVKTKVSEQFVAPPPAAPVRPKVRCHHTLICVPVRRWQHYKVRVCPSCETLMIAVPRRSAGQIRWIWKDAGDG